MISLKNGRGKDILDKTLFTALILAFIAALIICFLTIAGVM